MYNNLKLQDPPSSGHLLVKVNFLPLNTLILKDKTCLFSWKDLTALVPLPHAIQERFKFPTCSIKTITGFNMERRPEMLHTA